MWLVIKCSNRLAALISYGGGLLLVVGVITIMWSCYCWCCNCCEYRYSNAISVYIKFCVVFRFVCVCMYEWMCVYVWYQNHCLIPFRYLCSVYWLLFLSFFRENVFVSIGPNISVSFSKRRKSTNWPNVLKVKKTESPKWDNKKKLRYMRSAKTHTCNVYSFDEIFCRKFRMEV